MGELRRHELVRLSAAGWRCAMTQQAEEQARRCLHHWAAHDLPLVVATQSAGDNGVVALGLPAPLCWDRRRLSLRIARADLRRGDGTFPRLDECADALPNDDARWSDFLTALQRLLPAARVGGSFGWQRTTGLRYVRAGSDLDLLLPTAGVAHADTLAALLAGADLAAPRLDGEFCFDDGSAVAWREWAAWRERRTRAILVKRLRGAFLATDTEWLDSAALEAATP
jgi:phosphoribosyl-dephospho-CoA transferase